MSPLQIFTLFNITFIVVGTLTPLMRKIALRMMFVDRPSMLHKTHTEAVPYLGGVAIMIGIVGVSSIAILSQENIRNNFWIFLMLFAPAVALGIVGLIDDRKSLDPLPRFIAQCAAGIITAAFIQFTGTVGIPTGNVLLDGIFTITWIVGISNSINFFDNLDGGASSAIAAAALGLFLITQINGQFLISATALVIFAGMLGFLIWNKSPAKIYMGDAGSLFLGTIMATLTLKLSPDVSSKVVSFAIPMMLLAVPILDTSVAIMSRIRRRTSIFQGGKDHLSHRLLRGGLSKKETVCVLWFLSMTFVTFATLAATTTTNISTFLVYFSAAIWLCLFGIFMHTSDT